MPNGWLWLLLLLLLCVFHKRLRELFRTIRRRMLPERGSTEEFHELLYNSTIKAALEAISAGRPNGANVGINFALRCLEQQRNTAGTQLRIAHLKKLQNVLHTQHQIG